MNVKHRQMNRTLKLFVFTTAAALVISLSMGLRQSFGVFLGPVTLDLDLGRQTFAFAMAIQQIVWGLGQPIAGMLADRFGGLKVIVVGSVLYGLGLFVMSGATSAFDLNLGGGLLVGMGMAATSFAVVFGGVARIAPPEKRSMALGIVSSGGSFGQFVLAPLGQQLISAYGWPMAFVILAVMSLMMAPLALVFSSDTEKQHSEGAHSMKAAVSEAAGNKNYILLTAGFFVCGFQVLFVAVHLPSYIADLGLGADVGAWALGLIGLFNIFGTYACGHLGQIYSKRMVLSSLYFLRAAVFLVFILAPKTEMTVYLFASSLGLLWLGTVPLTSGLVGQIFGVRYLSTLFGFVFLSHQVGSFIGVWWGGYVYDISGSYDLVWYTTVALGVIAGLLHLPINESPLARKAPAE